MTTKKYTHSAIVKKLNNLFPKLEDTLKKDVELNTKTKTRKGKITFIDSLLYKFCYSVPESTKQKIVSSFNYDNKKTIDRTTFHKKEMLIPITTYKNMFDKVKSLYKELYFVNDKDLLLAVDGTFNNTNILNKKDNLETSLNMGYYDVTNDVPIELTFEGNKSKNNELHIFNKYLKEGKISKDYIIILDRLYCKFDFIDYLVNNGYKFVIRFRNNCKNFDKIKNLKQIRILKYFDVYDTNVTYEKYDNYINPKKGRKGNHVKVNTNLIKSTENKIAFKSVDITMKYEYTLLTNLPLNTHNDEKIKNIYKQRWDVEVFFKLLKYNFRFEHTLEHDDSESSTANIKLNLINLIIIYLSKIIEKVYYYDNDIVSEITKTNKVNGKTVNVVYKNKPNKSLIIDGIYKILKDIFNNKLTVENLESILDNYVKYSLVKQGIKKERKSKTPFLKWYVKGHSNRSLLCKIIEAKLTKNTDKLNKNHKLLYNMCTIQINK